MDVRLIIGETYGQLTAISISPPLASKSGKRQVLCQCACGRMSVAIHDNIRTGRTRSCGCENHRHKIGAESRTHGHAGYNRSLEYKTWTTMKKRLSDGPQRPSFRWYGGKGLDMDPRWNDFSVFLAEMGKRPSSKHTIDRIDNSRGYWPDNCCWATMKEQCANRGGRFSKVKNGTT